MIAFWLCVNFRNDILLQLSVFCLQSKSIFCVVSVISSVNNESFCIRLQARRHRPRALLLVHRPAQAGLLSPWGLWAGAGAPALLAAGAPSHPGRLPLPPLPRPLQALGTLSFKPTTPQAFFLQNTSQISLLASTN